MNWHVHMWVSSDGGLLHASDLFSWWRWISCLITRAPLARDGHGNCTASSAPLPPSRCHESNQLVLTVSRQTSAENPVSSPQFKVIQLTTRRNGDTSHNQEKQWGVKDQKAIYSLLTNSTRNLRHRVELRSSSLHQGRGRRIRKTRT